VQEGVGYADATGNLYLAVESPPIFIRDRGQDKYPSREPKPIRSLKGPAAARIVRTLCDVRPPYSLGELAKTSKTAQSSASRVAAYLDQQKLLERGKSGGILDVDWRNLLTTWSTHYQVLKSNEFRRYLDPRGLVTLPDRLAALNMPELHSQYAVTGSIAANRIAPYAPPAVGMLYTREPKAVMEALELREAQAGTNVLLLSPFDDVIFERAEPRGNIVCVALSQLVADLLTSPGRSPSEAGELLDWMGRNEDAWRR